MMADPEPSDRDSALWGGEQLVCLAGHFLPKRWLSHFSCCRCRLLFCAKALRLAHVE